MLITRALPSQVANYAAKKESTSRFMRGSRKIGEVVDKYGGVLVDSCSDYTPLYE